MSERADRRAEAASAKDTGRGRASWIGLGLGLGVMAYGVAGLLADSDATRPSKALTWLVGADVLHDAVLVPLLLAVGWLVGRAPHPLRWPLRASLIGTALTVAIGWIPVRGYGRLADNPSLAPLDYRTAIVAVVAGVWCTGASWAAVNLLAARRARRARSADS